MPTPIEVLWAELRANADRPVFRRVDETHSLDLYAGIDTNEAQILMLVTPEEPPAPPSYDAITVASRRRADGTWALVVELRAKELAIPFARLSQDLVDATRGCMQGGAGVLLARLARWHRLMELARSAVLPEQALRGLIGELLILRDVVAPRFTIGAAVDAWVGPQDASQDFVVAGIAVEVKTCVPTATSVRISSLEQLDAACPLFLATVRVTPSSAAQPAAFTPAQLVASIRQNAGENTPTRAELDLRLAEAGYEELTAYEDKWYQWDGTRYYRIVSGSGLQTFSAESYHNEMLTVEHPARTPATRPNTGQHSFRRCGARPPFPALRGRPQIGGPRRGDQGVGHRHRSPRPKCFLRFKVRSDSARGGRTVARPTRRLLRRP